MATTPPSATTTSTREQTHIALDKFRALTESLIEGIQESLQASRPQRHRSHNYHRSHSKQQGETQQEQQEQPAVTLVKDFSPVIKALTECEKSIRDLVARARRQEQLQLQTDKVKEAVVRNEERLVVAVFFPAHEVDGCLRRAINKSKFVCGTDEKSGGVNADTDEKPSSSSSASSSADANVNSNSNSNMKKACTIDPESLSSYLSSVRFMAPPSMKLFRYNDGEMEDYSVYSSASVDDEYRDHMATSTNADGDSGDGYSGEDMVEDMI